MWEIAAGRGRKPTCAAARVGQWIDATLQTKPAGATHWSTRTMARAQGVSKNTIQRAWQDHGLKPHLTKSFKLSRDPKFLEKLTDVVSVYLTSSEVGREWREVSRGDGVNERSTSRLDDAVGRTDIISKAKVTASAALAARPPFRPRGRSRCG